MGLRTSRTRRKPARGDFFCVSIEGRATTRRNQRHHTAKPHAESRSVRAGEESLAPAKTDSANRLLPALRALMREACLRRAGKGGASFTMQSFSADMPLIHKDFYTGLVIAQPE